MQQIRSPEGVLVEFSAVLQDAAVITASATIAIGFASKDVLGNFVSGVFIVADAVGWQYAFVPLAIGPLVGTLSMLRLRGRPEVGDRG